MDDLKNLTLRSLRALARRHIGRGHSKLKTKAQLLTALKDWLPRQAKQSRRVKLSSGPTKRSVAAKVSRVAQVERATRADEREATRKRVAGNDGPHRGEPPLIEGFFVARVAGEREARRHRLDEASRSSSAEARAGERVAPLREDDSELRMRALARDPETLFAFWDFPNPTWEYAARGLRSPRPVLRVFQGSEMVRELDFAPESRSFYIHHLTPGQQYRVEAHVLSADGESRQVGYPSAVVELPRSGFSEGEARFAQLPWDSDVRSERPEGARIMDAETARSLAAQFQGPGREVFNGSSEERRWPFSPSGSGRS